jgi:hypothetical protein
VRGAKCEVRGAKCEVRSARCEVRSGGEEYDNVGRCGDGLIITTQQKLTLSSMLEE